MQKKSLKNQLLLMLTFLVSFAGIAQLPNPAIVGYWESWDGSNFVKLKNIDSRYNVIHVSFASGKGNLDYDLEFKPPGSYNDSVFKSEIAILQTEGKKVFISIGGQNDNVMLDSLYEKTKFVSSVNAIVDKWGFDGIDIDLEGKSLSFDPIRIETSSDPRLHYMIDGIREVMANHYSTHGKKLLLTMAPETNYVQGGLSDWAVNNAHGGAYLPIIEELEDSIDMLNVQLYNSGSMYGLDRRIYKQGSADWILAMTEAVITGFTGTGDIGTYSGFPSSKIGVGLPGCHSSDAVPHLEIEKALSYLRGLGPKPGNYTLLKEGGYPDIMGMMTWSINSDRKCYPTYGYVDTWSKIFTDDPYILISNPIDIHEQEEEGAVIQVDLLNDKFKNPLDTSNWILNELPEGVVLDSLVRINDSTVNIVLGGGSIDPYKFSIKNVFVSVNNNDLIKSTETLSRAQGVLLQKHPTKIPGKLESEYIVKEKNGVIHSMNNDAWNNQNAHFLRLNNGDWGAFNVDVATEGTYTVDWRFTTGSTASGAIKLKVDNSTKATVSYSGSGGYTDWQTLSFDVELTAGEHTMELNMYNGWIASDYMEFRLTTGVNSIKSTNQLFYPNPAEKTIHFKEAFKGSISVYGLNGELVQESTNLNTSSYNVSDINTGIYILKYTSTEGEIIYNKLVKK